MKMYFVFALFEIQLPSSFLLMELQRESMLIEHLYLYFRYQNTLLLVINYDLRQLSTNLFI
jgi:hypothetical protein